MVLPQRKNKGEYVAKGVAKCIKFSSENIDDATSIGQHKEVALMMEIKWQKIRLKWYEETLREEKKNETRG